ncbi:hypothetical protein HDU93_005390, partial [Gonapodya sp. JEL0774]
NFRMTKDLCAFVQRIYDAPFEPADTPTSTLSLPSSRIGPQKQNTESTDQSKLIDQVFERPVQSLVTIQMKWPSSTDPTILPYESHLEAEEFLVTGLVQDLRSNFPQEKIFVVTPHRLQRVRITRALDQLIGEKMRVDTVERMQGDEADIVVVCY